jgi:protoporphyrinogen oxidase
MRKLTVVGAGISGLSIANLLKDKYIVEVFEKDSRPGGLIKCDRVEGNLYHMVGGHVFNSRRKDVLNWFWKFFDRDSEFTKSIRNAVVYLGKPINYPIENHLYQLDNDLMKSAISDLLEIAKANYPEPTNFEEFLRYRFGDTLYKLYFKPYNKKIWKRDLSNVPLSWIEGKLPMPTVEEIIFNNFNKEKEMKMVHSTFFYPKKNGSQFLANRLAGEIDIAYNTAVNSLTFKNKKWIINSDYECDFLVFAGNIKELPNILDTTLDVSDFYDEISALEYHGTTSVLCEIEPNSYSWIYLPDKSHSSHRVICTGNFSENNNRNGIKTATIEFTDYIDKNSIIENLSRIPYSPRYIAHKYTEYTYPIQNTNTRAMISSLKQKLEPKGLFLIGRFAEWEYYNMDAAIGAALDLSKIILNR